MTVFNSLTIGDGIFTSKCIHEAVCILSDDSIINQIDHIWINKRFKKFIEGVKTMRELPYGVGWVKTETRQTWNS